MKNALILFAFLSFTFCKSPVLQKPLPVTQVEATSGEMILLGEINRANLDSSSLTDWFVKAFNEITIDPNWTSKTKPHIEGVEIKVFMGTWCDDSHRQIPHFLKILGALNFNPNNIKIYAMSEEKTTPKNWEKSLEIFNIPTLIFYKNNIEMNRIVEFPKTTLESDLEKILNGESYSHSYL